MAINLKVLDAVLSQLAQKMGVQQLECLIGQVSWDVEVIDEDDIVERVMDILRDTHTSVCMTMLLSEELDAPLTGDYHDLIERLLREGRKITRIGFGLLGSFIQIRDRLDITSQNFRFLHVEDETAYQRMILVDEGVLFFNHEGVFYMSRNPQIIECFKAYFKAMELKGDGP